MTAAPPPGRETALVISPHFDDAVFSCGGTMASMADAGWRVVMATAFTRSIHPAQGFALACQLDKGLPPEADYMALRRAEDEAAAEILDIEALCLDLPEAPHRGYESAPALFGPIRPEDDVWRTLAGMVAGLVRDLAPAVVLCPQGLGAHVDHRQAIRAVQEAVGTGEAGGAGGMALAFYRDTPYAIRNPEALQYETLPPLQETRHFIAPTLDRKIAAACAYRTQLGFQFGGPDEAAAALRRFAEEEGQGRPAERFLGQIAYPSQL